MRRRILLPTSAALVLASAGAFAAVPPPCVPATVAPSATSIPTNLPGFAYTAVKPKAGDVQLFDVTAGQTEVPLALEAADGITKATPTTPLVEGKRYRLEHKDLCSYGATPTQQPVEFTAAAAAPLPTSVGAVRGQPVVTVKDFGTSKMTVTGSFTVADDLKPWLSVYQLLVTVDGRALATKPTVSSARDVVTVTAEGWCDETNAATRTHTIGLRAKLPFAPTLESTAATVTFDCPAPRIARPPKPVIEPYVPGQAPSGGAPTPSAQSSGCALSGGPGDTGALFSLATVALAALVARRARRAGGGR